MVPFEYEVYTANRKKLSIVAIDESGKRSPIISVDRSSVMVPKGPQFAALNPAGRPKDKPQGVADRRYRRV